MNENASTTPADMTSSPLRGSVFYISTNELHEMMAPVLEQTGAEPLRFEKEDGGEGQCPRPPFVLIVSETGLTRYAGQIQGLLQSSLEPNPLRLIVVGDGNGKPDFLSSQQVFAYLPGNVQRDQLLSCIRNASELCALQKEARQLARDLDRRTDEMRDLIDIGTALSAERNLDVLLEMIVQKSRELTNADAGSLYLVEETEDGQRKLRFQLSQNDSLQVPYRKSLMEMTTKSIAGYVALTGRTVRIDDVYSIPDTAEYGFNRSFDTSTGYRTKSMMTVAMRNYQGDIVGAIQLINRKRDGTLKITSAEVVEREVEPFTDYSEQLISSLASQAAVALENNRLIREIEKLFEGFVNASIIAIEQRDPTTQGHSKRVAVYTVGLAQAMDSVRTGKYRDLKFSPQQIKEIRYASLLHDVGKIGVRENVLVKAKKLYDENLQLIEGRFRIARECLQRELARRKMESLLQIGKEEFPKISEQLDRQFVEELKVIDQFLEMIKLANEPQILAAQVGSGLREITKKTYLDMSGNPLNLLDEEEIKILCIPKGSLSETERKEIESHVTKSFNFLRTIPWTKDLKNIPEIAYAHHEKLDGSGYPRGLKDPEIPIQAKMMTISDIYDALTAADRPYKKAVPVDRALNILTDESKHGFIDSDLLQIFIESGSYKLTA